MLSCHAPELLYFCLKGSHLLTEVIDQPAADQHQQGGDGRWHPDREDPEPSERPPWSPRALRLCRGESSLDLRHQAGAYCGVRRHRRQGMREQSHHFAECSHFTHRILVSSLQTRLESCCFLRFERPQDVEGAEFLQFLGGHGRSPTYGSSTWRSRVNPNRMRVLMVPRGCPRRLAIAA